MSIITSLNKQATNLARKALRLGNDFVHPVSDDSGNTPDYNDPNSILSPDGHIELPHTAEWGPGYPSTTFLDPETGLLTTKTEGNPPLDEGTSIYDIYADRAARMGDEPLYTFKQDGDWHTKTANETLADIRAVAKGLLHYGLKKGDGVAFMCRTSYDWDVFDAAVMACGGVLATIYDTDSAEQIRNIVNNSDARLLVVETTDMKAKADGAETECPTLEHIVCFETGGLDEIKAYGSGVSDEALDARIDSVQKTDLCSIVYTSGSTAAPKGVEMTHEHYCATAFNLPDYMPELLHDKKIAFRSVSVVGKRRLRVTVRGVDPSKINIGSRELSYMLSTLLMTHLGEPEFVMTGQNGTEMRLSSLPVLRVECAKATVGKAGEAVCGDTVSFFESDGGYFYSLISDGMGSGREAELASRLASIFLEKLLELGAEAGETLKMLNRMLITKDEEVFTTVDLLEIDRMTGDARIIKAGAAPTFIYRQGECYRLDARTAPVGIISEVRAAETKLKLKRGDYIVMTSDGITPTDPKPSLPPTGESKTAAALAGAIINRWSESAATGDDMSVSVIRIA